MNVGGSGSVEEQRFRKHINNDLAPSPHLRRCVGAALWWVADRRVTVFCGVLDTGFSMYVYIGDGKDALAVGAWDFSFIPVFVHSANKRNPLSLCSDHKDNNCSLKLLCAVHIFTSTLILMTHFFERHFYHCVSIEIEASNSFSIFQDLNGGTFLWLGFFRGGKQLHKKTTTLNKQRRRKPIYETSPGVLCCKYLFNDESDFLFFKSILNSMLHFFNATRQQFCKFLWKLLRKKKVVVHLETILKDPVCRRVRLWTLMTQLIITCGDYNVSCFSFYLMSYF